jgi:hypothetical protein
VRKIELSWPAGASFSACGIVNGVPVDDRAAALSSIGFDFVDPAVEASARAVLEAVEGELRTAVTSSDPFVTGTSSRRGESASGRCWSPSARSSATRRGRWSCRPPSSWS